MTVLSKLYFRYGAMNFGKTTALIQVAHNYKERGMNSIIIKPKTDTKGNNLVVSRLGIVKEVDMLVDDFENIYEKVDEYITKNGKIDFILVDEVHFFKKDHIDLLFEVAVVLDIPTIWYGLSTVFMMNGFEGSERY